MRYHYFRYARPQPLNAFLHLVPVQNRAFIELWRALTLHNVKIDGEPPVSDLSCSMILWLTQEPVRERNPQELNPIHHRRTEISKHVSQNKSQTASCLSPAHSFSVLRHISSPSLLAAVNTTLTPYLPPIVLSL